MQINRHFNQFIQALQGTLGLAFEVEPVTAKVLRVRFGTVPLQVLYYLPGAGGRIENGTEAGSTEVLPSKPTLKIIHSKPKFKTIHIDEDRWIHRADCLVARLRSQAGLARKIHARDTVVARIDKKQALHFQAEHHLHVPLPGKFRFGLFLKGELVSIAVFSGGRKMKGKPDGYRSFELLRTCHKSGLTVVGGLSKLIRSFEDLCQPGDIMTYVDRDWSDGQSYFKLDFQLAGELPPQEFWLAPHTLHRYTDFDLPEEVAAMTPEVRQEQGWCRLHNSGSLKLIRPGNITGVRK